MAGISEKPSILFILTDQWRADCLSCAGHPEVRTPHLDALAGDGVRFSRVVTQAPLCMPARAALFTGRYPHQTGCLNNAVGLWPETPNMVRAIRDAGYETANRGKLHLFWRHDVELLMADPLAKAFGFTDPEETTGKCSQGRLRASTYTEHLRKNNLLEPFWQDLIRRVETRTLDVMFGPSILSEEDQMDGWIMDRGREFLQSRRERDDAFLLWVGPEGPHDPFDPPGRWATMYDPATLQTGQRRASEDPLARARAQKDRAADAPDEMIQEMRANYYGNISFLDHKIGELVAELKESGRYDTTWIVFSSDHGEMLGDFHLTGKNVFHRQAVEVPLIIKPPRLWEGCPRGQACDALVELIDVGTTLRDIAGGELPGDQGRSLRRILAGETSTHRTSAVSQLEHAAMMQTDRWKMVFRNAENPEVLAFYDLGKDPEELHNLADKEPAEIAAFLADHVAPFFASTRETLPAPWKEGAPYAAWGGRNPYFEILG